MIEQRLGKAPRSESSRAISRFVLAAFVALGFLAIGQANTSRAIAAGQPAFPTPDAAVDALVAAVKASDVEKLIGLFGQKYKDELIGGDEIALRAGLKNLAGALEEAASLHDAGEHTKTLIVGAKAWPFPFPLVKRSGAWRFDTEAGLEEAINRRIGRNELSAIELCGAYKDAQVQYASRDRDGDQVREFAQKILSEPGQHDGLYWDAKAGEELSPFGPLVADARDYLEGREVGDPFKGYYYKIITRQGSETPGGRYDYIINGNMIAGFALIAFPADHGNSGIMTFICNHQGRVYQKDLGEDGDLIAGATVVYNPEATWSEVRD